MSKKVKKTKEEKIVSVQYIRIFCMFSILICHLLNEQKTAISNASQFFNVGVTIFFYISGYLAYNKKIVNYKQYCLKKIKRILVPMWIFMICLLIIHYFYGSLEYKKILTYLFNLQYWFGGINGAQHLWFISQIFIFYLISPYIKEENVDVNKLHFIFLIGSFSCYLNVKIGDFVKNFVLYLTGYYINKENVLHNNFYSCLIVIISIIVRLISRACFDGTILYDKIIVSISHSMLGIGLFL